MTDKIKQIDGIMWISIDLIHSVSTTESFNKTFEGLLVGTTSFTEAYEKTEQIHEQVMGVRRFASYDSFSHVRKKIIK